MSNIMNGTTAKNMMESAMDGAEHAADTAKHAVDNVKHAAGSAKKEARHVISDGLAMVVTGVKAVTGIMSVVRALGVDDALGWMGLRRRRDPLRSFVLFGAGLAVGVGVAVLVTPKSGPQLRRMIERGVKSFLGEAKETIERVESEVKVVEEKVEAKAEDLAGRAKGAALRVEHKVEAAAGAVMDAVEGSKPTHAAALHTTPDNGHRQR